MGGGIELPEIYKDVADTPIEELAANRFSKRDVSNGLNVLFITTYDANNKNLYINYIRQGAIVISSAIFEDENGILLPYFRLDREKLYSTWQAIGAYIKDLIEVPTIGITGSVGKTTTTAFMRNIFSERGKVFVSGGNLNVWDAFINQMLKRYDSTYKYHIQEVGGGRPTLVEESARVLNSDAFCITNILPHHLNKYKNIDGILYDKTSFDRVSKKNAFAVINMDDDKLKEFKFNHRIVTCGIRHKEADYVACNIKQNGVWLEMDIHFRNEYQHIRINIPGVHNAYNALYSFAMAKEWGLSNDEIKNGFLKYKSDDIRQSVKEVSGRTIYLDCFNICAESINSSLEALEQMKKSPANRTIAILGGENALGEESFSVNYSVGLDLDKHNIDEFIFLGVGKNASEDDKDRYGDAYAMYEGAKKVLRNKNLRYCDDLDTVADIIAKETEPGDAILVKGIIHRPFFPIIDMAFGTSYSNYNQFAVKKKVEDENYIATYCVNINGCNIMKCKNINKIVKIPNLINHYPIFRIGRDVFSANDKITSIDFGKSVVNIGKSSFRGCTGLQTIDLPYNIIHIEEYAFAECEGLQEISLKGVEHIEKYAFKDCKNLKSVYISGSCATIEEGVFDGIDDFVIRTPQGSYAAEYGRKSGYRVELLK
ncbi:MAG: Mur ligase family protein [Anaerovoracaceae bacterium]